MFRFFKYSFLFYSLPILATEIEQHPSFAYKPLRRLSNSSDMEYLNCLASLKQDYDDIFKNTADYDITINATKKYIDNPNKKQSKKNRLKLHLVRLLIDRLHLFTESENIIESLIENNEGICHSSIKELIEIVIDNPYTNSNHIEKAYNLKVQYTYKFEKENYINVLCEKMEKWVTNTAIKPVENFNNDIENFFNEELINHHDRAILYKNALSYASHCKSHPSEKNLRNALQILKSVYKKVPELQILNEIFILSSKQGLSTSEFYIDAYLLIEDTKHFYNNLYYASLKKLLTHLDEITNSKFGLFLNYYIGNSNLHFNLGTKGLLNKFNDLFLAYPLLMIKNKKEISSNSLQDFTHKLNKKNITDIQEKQKYYSIFFKLLIEKLPQFDESHPQYSNIEKQIKLYYNNIINKSLIGKKYSIPLF